MKTIDLCSTDLWIYHLEVTRESLKEELLDKVLLTDNTKSYSCYSSHKTAMQWLLGLGWLFLPLHAQLGLQTLITTVISRGSIDWGIIWLG